ncbi:hypothetical protein D3Z50_20045 [Clostridiaceae bacterium]|nr:hypothetical protein [Clostridiaceae bacterium]
MGHKVYESAPFFHHLLLVISFLDHIYFSRFFRLVNLSRQSQDSESLFYDEGYFHKNENITKKWTQRYRGWDQVLNQLIVLYGKRLTVYL